MVQLFKRYGGIDYFIMFLVVFKLIDIWIFLEYILVSFGLVFSQDLFGSISLMDRLLFGCVRMWLGLVFFQENDLFLRVFLFYKAGYFDGCQVLWFLVEVFWNKLIYRKGL